VPAPARQAYLASVKRQFPSHCSRNPDFAHPVLMIIRICSLIRGFYSVCAGLPGGGEEAAQLGTDQLQRGTGVVETGVQ
jgi:hypothetical protein